MTQQVYGVFNRYRNLTPSSQPLTVGSERDLSYRATTVVPGPRGSTIEGGVHLQWLGGALDEYRYLRRRPAALGRRRGAADAAGRPISRPGCSRTAPSTIAPGIRVDRFGTSDETLASPWIQCGARPARPLPASPAAAALYRQAPDLLQAANPFGDPVHAERARHLDLGLGQEIGVVALAGDGLRPRRRRHAVLREPGGPPGRTAGRAGQSGPPLYANALDGRVRGVELTLAPSRRRTACPAGSATPTPTRATRTGSPARRGRPTSSSGTA